MTVLASRFFSLSGFGTDRDRQVGIELRNTTRSVQTSGIIRILHILGNMLRPAHFYYNTRTYLKKRILVQSQGSREE